MPLTPTNEIPVVPGTIDPTAMSGGLYFIMLLFFGSILLILFVGWIIIKIWGSPIITAKTSRSTGKAIIQHLENSRIGILKLASIGGGAIRHAKVEDGTLITIPKGINNLQGHSFVNSWHLTGISVPTFLIGGITKLRQLGITTREALEHMVDKNTNYRFANLIEDSYNFNEFNDILEKSENPTRIPLEMEYVNDFIPSINQHYTEADISDDVWVATADIPDKFTGIFLTTGIVSLCVGIGLYLVMGAVGKG